MLLLDQELCMRLGTICLQSYLEIQQKSYLKFGIFFRKRKSS
ncbi:hypothetical protein X975_10768, partial [Stegodyphus mimosarum]